jgi:hypothetical protein
MAGGRVAGHAAVAVIIVVTVTVMVTVTPRHHHRRSPITMVAVAVAAVAAVVVIDAIYLTGDTAKDAIYARPQRSAAFGSLAYYASGSSGGRGYCGSRPRVQYG